MLKSFFSHYALQIGCHLHNTLKNIPRKWHNYKKSFLRNFNKADASYHQSIYSICVWEHWCKHNGSVFSINSISKVLLTQPFHCIPYQHKISKTGFQVLWTVSNPDLIWRHVLLQVICMCTYRICCYSILTAVRALTERLSAKLHLLLMPGMLHSQCLSWEQKHDPYTYRWVTSCAKFQISTAGSERWF